MKSGALYSVRPVRATVAVPATHARDTLSHLNILRRTIILAVRRPLTKGRNLAKVCGWGYVMDYDEWATRLARWAANETPPAASEAQRYICPFCGLIYVPVLGLPEDGIAPGTAFEDILDDWRCTDCGVEKASFVPLD